MQALDEYALSSSLLYSLDTAVVYHLGYIIPNLRPASSELLELTKLITRHGILQSLHLRPIKPYEGYNIRGHLANGSFQLRIEPGTKFPNAREPYKT
jgi:hypothetical protein